MSTVEQEVAPVSTIARRSRWADRAWSWLSELDWRRILWRVAVVCVLLDIALWATLKGLDVRKHEFIDTYGVHFHGDVHSGFNWGMMANSRGLFDFYDDIAEDVNNGRRTNDYSPLRLTAVWAWVRWAQAKYPYITEWEDDYDLTRPMLIGNTIAEFASAVLVFLIIRHWRIRVDDARRRRRKFGRSRRAFRGVVPGMIGALLFWFNPAVIRDGHCWPQWDVWLVPFFLGALLLASLDWWFAAGMSLMIGAAFKGQLLIAAPIMLLWPLFALRIEAVVSLVCGFAFAGAAVALPWMKLDHPAAVWCARFALAIVALMPVTSLRMRRARDPGLRNTSDPGVGGQWKLWCAAACGTLALVLVVWGTVVTPAGNWRFVPLGLLVLVAVGRWLPRRVALALHGGAIAAIIFMTIPLFNASSNWYTVGFRYGTEKFNFAINPSDAWNIGKMQQTYQPFDTSYSLPSDTVITVPLLSKDPLTYRTVSLILYGACLVICGIGAAMHSRRRRPSMRFFVAIVTPWVCFFMLLPQMHGRYLMWAAGLSALLAGVSAGMTILGILISCVSWMNIAANQYASQPQYDPSGLRTLQALDPHVGWMVLLIMGIFLWTAVTRDRARSEAG
jgi:hypothetical protein